MVSILQEIGKLHKPLLTDFFTWYAKNYKLPLSQFVKLEFELQLGVLIKYLNAVHYVLVYCDEVGNVIAYVDRKKNDAIIKHEYKEGGILNNYIVGIIRAFIVIKERKKL